MLEELKVVKYSVSSQGLGFSYETKRLLRLSGAFGGSYNRMLLRTHIGGLFRNPGSRESSILDEHQKVPFSEISKGKTGQDLIDWCEQAGQEYVLYRREKGQDE